MQLDLKPSFWPPGKYLTYLKCPDASRPNPCIKDPAYVNVWSYHWLGQLTKDCGPCTQVKTWRDAVGVRNCLGNSFNIPPDFDVTVFVVDIKPTIKNLEDRIATLEGST